MLRRASIALAAITLLAGCGGPSDHGISKGVEELELAYIQYVKPDGVPVSCNYREIEQRHFAVCGLNYGAAQLAQRGLWEIVAAGSDYTIYALNGKALSALDKIGEGGHFLRGHDRSRVEAAFDFQGE